MRSFKRIQIIAIAFLMAAFTTLAGLNRPTAAEDAPTQPKAIIESVAQDGRTITPEDCSHPEIAAQAFTVNDSEDIILHVRFEDLGDAPAYWFMTRDAYVGQSFTREEMLAGIDLNLSGHGYGTMDDGYKYANYLSFFPGNTDHYPYGTMNQNAMLYYNDQSAALHVVRDPSAKTLTASISDQVKQRHDATGGSFLSPLDHDADHPVILTVQGTNFEPDQDYEILIQAFLNAAESDYEPLLVTKTGAEINAGTDIALAGLTLRFAQPDATALDALGAYNFVVKAGGITNREADVVLSYGDFDVALFYGNGEPNSTALGAGGAPNFVDRELLVSKALFEEYGHIYLYPFATGFPADTEFQYEIYYGNNISWFSNNALASATKISSHIITGAELNNGAKPFKLERQSDDDKPCYAVIIKHNNEIVAAVATAIQFVEGEALTTMTFSAGADRQIYYNYGDGFSISTNGTATAHIKGYGYEADKTYQLMLTEKATYLTAVEQHGETIIYSEDETLATKTITVTGANLNAGRVIYQMDKVANTENLYSHSLSARIIYNDGHDDNYILGREIYSAFLIVEPADYFSTDNPYNFDNVSAYIKGVSKQTSIDDFATKMGAEGSNHIAIYNSSNQAISSGNIGTGMTARLEDEYNRPIMEMPVVVTGDLTGDGDITITDLVMEARALAELIDLTGAYKSAGDITGSGDITITDVVKISRDVAGIEEIK